MTTYALRRSVDAGSYNDVTLPSGTATFRTLLRAPGRDYRHRVRATDDNGNKMWGLF